MLYYAVKWLLTVVFYILWMPRVYGHRNLNTKGGVIYICNHRSMLDPLLLALITPRFIHFMAKSELFEKCPIRLLMKSLLAFPVNRNSVDPGSIRTAINLVKDGKAIGIFPEGTRAVTDGVDELERGTAFMAMRARVPVVPIYIPPNTYGKFRPIVLVGEPIDIESTINSVPKAVVMDVLADKLADSIYSLESVYDKKYAKKRVKKYAKA